MKTAARRFPIRQSTVATPWSGISAHSSIISLSIGMTCAIMAWSRILDGRKCNKDFRVFKDFKVFRVIKDFKDLRDTKDPKDPKDPKDLRDFKDFRDPKDPKDFKDFNPFNLE